MPKGKLKSDLSGQQIYASTEIKRSAYLKFS